ncbi:DUF58 domain-containing protein [Microbacterium aurantiacum]|uniref:DUF58 domain-containing protein n=1 Tax=Microbacterium aurantiacum TaxID=162393 RepID=UPI003D7078F8
MTLPAASVPARARGAWPLTVRGTGAVFLAGVSVVLAHESGIVELLYFGILLAAMPALGFLSLLLVRRTEPARRVIDPETVTVGRPSRVRVRVGLRSVLPVPPGTWRDDLGDGLDGAAAGILPAFASGLRGGTPDERAIDFVYTVTGSRRGVHELGPLAVTLTDPFGLVRRRVRFPSRTSVTVAPAIVDLTGLTDAPGESGGTLHATTDRLGQGADNLVARPYAPGDSMRRIHWRATAHRDQLMVRQEESESTPEASVVLDRGALRWSVEAQDLSGEDAAFDAAVSACISATARLVRDGYAVEVVDEEGGILAERIESGDTAEVEELRTRLALITAHRDSGLAALTRQFANASTGPVVVVTGRFDTGDAAALAPLAPHSALPLLLCTDPLGDAVEHAASAGWRVGVLGRDGDVAAAWADAARRGARHVAH